MKGYIVFLAGVATLAVVLGANADTDWVAIGIGFAIGCVFAFAVVALWKTLGMAKAFARMLFATGEYEKKPAPPKPAERPVVDAAWRDATAYAEVARVEIALIEDAT